MIKKISLGVFYAFLIASFLELLKPTFFSHLDLNIILASLSLKRIIIIGISGFCIGALIAGIIEKKDSPIELGSKKSGYLILLGTFIAFLCSIFWF